MSNQFPKWLNTLLFVISAVFASIGIGLMAWGLILALFKDTVHWAYPIAGAILVAISTIINIVTRLLK